MQYRQALGQILRDARLERGLTLRDVSAKASIALGYLSEVERGQKEISSELLGPLANSLGYEVHELVIAAGYRLGIRNGFLERSAQKIRTNVYYAR